MPKPEQETKISIPPAPSTGVQGTGGWRPDQTDPELANLAMAKLLLDKLGTPSKITPDFNIRKALLEALNHRGQTINEKGEIVDKGNRTGIDTSLLIAVFDAYELGTVNEGGAFFTAIWAFLMKPRYILSGYAGMPEDKPKEDGWLTKAGNAIFGAKKKEGTDGK